MVNRYTNLSTSDYDPLSLQEMMMVPLAQQKKHNDLLDNKDLMTNQLANLKRLQGDDEYATGEIESYRNNLEEIANKIGKEGINRETSRNFRKMFNDYNYAMSDSGDLGKIQNNYKLAKEKESVFRKQMQKLGHTEEYISKKIKSGYDGFSTLGDDGSYNQFQDFQGGKFYDPRVETINYMKSLPYNQRTIIDKGINDGSIIQMDNGMLKVIRSKDGLLKENVDQVNAGITGLIDSYKQGDRKDFKDHYFSEEGSLENHIKTTARPYIFKQQIDPKDTSYYMNGRKGTSSNKGKKDKIDTHGLIGDIGSTTRYFEGQDLAGIKDNISRLKQDKNFNEARRLENHLKRVESKFSNTEIANVYDKKLNGYLDDNGNNVEGLSSKINKIAGKYSFVELLGTGGAQQTNIKENNNLTVDELLEDDVSVISTDKYIIGESDFGYNIPQLKEHENGQEYTTLLTSKGKRVIPTETWNEIKNTKNVKKIYDDALQTNLDTYAANTREYQFKKLEPKERTAMNVETKQTLRNFSTDKFAISSASIFNREDNKEESIKDLDNPIKQKELFNMFQHADTKVELNKYTGQNISGNPAVNVTVTYKGDEDKAQTYNMWVDLKDFKSTTGNLQSSNNIFTNMLEQYGGTDGKNVSAKIKQRDRYKDIQPTYARDYSISDNIKSKINPNLSNLYNNNELDIIKDSNLSRFNNVLPPHYINHLKQNPYAISIKEGDNEKLSNWSQFIEVKEGGYGFKNINKNLVKKLSQELKILSGQSISDLKENGTILNYIEMLINAEVPISNRDTYDLMDLIAK